MYATDFEFSGLLASDNELVIANIDKSAGVETVEAGGKITFITSKATNSNKWKYHGGKYEEPLSFSFQVIRFDCINGAQEITAERKAFYLRWLQRTDGYKYLRFMQDGYEDIFYNVKIELKWINVGGKTYGAELICTCDAPYGYSNIFNYEISANDGDSFTIENTSDEIGHIYPTEIIIEILSNGDLVIENNMEADYVVAFNKLENRTVIEDCKTGEIITMNGYTKQIECKNGNDIANRFNWQFPRLINTDLIYPVLDNKANILQQYRNNIFTVKGCSVNIKMHYRVIRKAVVI